MSNEELNRLKWQRPFLPFRVTTIENEVFDVMAAGLILVGQNDVTIGLPHPQMPPPAASDLVWLGIDAIITAEPLTPQV